MDIGGLKNREGSELHSFQDSPSAIERINILGTTRAPVDHIAQRDGNRLLHLPI
jgi:hypothetical protein